MPNIKMLVNPLATIDQRNKLLSLLQVAEALKKTINNTSSTILPTAKMTADGLMLTQQNLQKEALEAYEDNRQNNKQDVNIM